MLSKELEHLGVVGTPMLMLGLGEQRLDDLVHAVYAH